MSRIAYVNGRYLPHAAAGVHIEDRGYQFADAVYEVMAVHDGRLVDLDPHLERLHRSLAEMRIDFSLSDRALMTVIAETARRNRVRDGIVYLQISRGVSPRGHVFPNRARPSLVVTARPISFAALADQARRGVRVITLPDLRWRRCDIKTVGLTANILAKQAAREASAFEAWLVDEAGKITEGSSTNAWIVDRDGRLITRPLDHGILGGVMRTVVLDLARQAQIEVVERAFSVADALAAAEAFLTSTTSLVMPVTKIDGQAIGDGRPGPISRRLRQLYMDHETV